MERVVREVISDRTGYPVDMIEPDLDLEADLSIDSIKRAEIAGELAQRLGIAGGAKLLADAELEELAKARTAAAVTAWLTARTGAPSGELTAGAPSDQGTAVPDPAGATSAAGTSGAVARQWDTDGTASVSAAGTSAPMPAAGVAAASASAAGTSASAADLPRGVAPQRCELRPVPLPDPEPGRAADLSGRRFVVLGGGEAVVAEVTARLAGRGAETAPLGHGHLLGAADGPVDGVLHLGALPGRTTRCCRTPSRCSGRRWRAAPACCWPCAPPTAPGRVRAAGLDGLIRSVGREYPDLLARVLAVGDTGPAAVADAILAELGAPEPAPVVLRTAAGHRRGLELVAAPLGPLGTTGAGPAGDGAAEAAALGLDRDSVVLLVGGARGITARFAATLATACRCRIELLGRTPRPHRARAPAHRRGPHPRRAAGRARRRPPAPGRPPRSTGPPHGSSPSGDHHHPRRTHRRRQPGPATARWTSGNATPSSRRSRRSTPNTAGPTASSSPPA